MKKVLIVLMLALVLTPLVCAQKHADLIVNDDGSGEFRFSQEEGLTCAKGLESITASLFSAGGKNVYERQLTARLTSFDLASFDLIYFYTDDSLNYSGSATYENDYIYDFAESTISYNEGNLYLVSTFKGIIRESSITGSLDNLNSALEDTLSTCSDVNGVITVYNKTENQVMFSVSINNYKNLFKSECARTLYNLKDLKSISVAGLDVPNSEEAYSTAKIEKAGSSVSVTFSGSAIKPDFSYDDLTVHTTASYDKVSKELLVTSTMSSSDRFLFDNLANQFSFYPAVSGADLNVVCGQSKKLSLQLDFNKKMFNDRRPMDVTPIGSMTVGNDVINIFNSQVLIFQSPTGAVINYLEIPKSYYALPLTFITGTLVVGISKPIDLFTITLAPGYDLMNYTIEPSYKEPGYYEWQEPRSLYFLVTPSELKPSITEPVLLVVAVVFLIGFVAFGIKLIFAKVKEEKDKGEKNE